MDFEQEDNILEEDFDVLDDAEELPPPPESQGARKSQRKRVNKSQENGNKRRLTADCWKHLTIIGEKGPDGKEDVRCNYCGKIYHWDLHRNGTTTLNTHWKTCKKRPKDNDVGAMMLDYEGKMRARKLDQKIFREMIAMAIIEHGLPYSFVEYRRIRNALTYANPDIKYWSRNTAASDCSKVFEKEKQNLKIELAEIQSRVCLTTDLWSSIVKEGYICLTAHYVDKDWKLQNKILSFSAFPPPHSGYAIAMKLMEILKEWGLEKKVFSLTVDNASANDTMQTILKKKLQNDLLCGGEFFHVRCSAHILNLIVQDGLAKISGALQKIRESVKFVKASEGREDMYENCKETVGLQIKAGLALDVATRWNSTYHMLDRAIKHRDALHNLHEIEASYTSFPSDIEWQKGKAICELLKPFDEITKLFSGSTYPTSNLYFMQIWNIECCLRRHALSTDKDIRDMVQPMQLKFDKYWEEYSDILAIGAVLDPRMKFALLEFCFTTLDASTCKKKLDHVRSKMYKLFDSYKSNSRTAASTSSSQGLARTFDGNAPMGYSVSGDVCFHFSILIVFTLLLFVYYS